MEESTRQKTTNSHLFEGLRLFYKNFRARLGIF